MMIILAIEVAVVIMLAPYAIGIALMGPAALIGWLTRVNKGGR